MIGILKKMMIASLIFMSGMQASLASGWVPKKGSGFFKIGQSFIFADQFFSNEGRRSAITTSGFFTSSLYGEYGATDRITVGTYVPFLFRSYVNGMEFTSGRTTIEPMEANDFGDVDFFVKYGLLQNKPLVLSAILLLGIPTGESDGLLTSGDGEFNQMIGLNTGFNIPKFPGFMGASVAFNNRTNGFSDEFRFNAEVGYQYKAHTLILKSLNTWSLRNGDDLQVAGGIFSNNISYNLIGPELLLGNLVKNVGLSLNYYVTLSGENTVSNDQFGVGVFAKF